jgi:non-ribosomal peptide synthetase component E (peptide arylation enzyme)
MNPLAAKLHGVFSQYSERPALEVEGCQWRYQDLWGLSHKIAAELERRDTGGKTLGITANNFVGILSGMLGAVLANRPFLCVASGLPERDRLALFKDANVGWLLDDQSLTPWDLAEKSNGSLPSEACCVVCTSGSTGSPLGVMHSHQSLLHNAEVTQKIFEIGTGDRLTVLTSPMFAAAHSHLWCGLLHGATLLPLSVQRGGTERLSAWIRDTQASICHIGPGLLQSLTRAFGPKHPFPSLRFLRVGGEALPPSVVQEVLQCFGDSCGLVLSYGLSENGGTLAFSDNLRHKNAKSELPAFKECEGYSISLINESGEVGDEGEIVVESPYLALGYAGQPHRTSERFRGGRLWTGDQGRRDASGQLLLLGRNDRQIKIRGNRVSLPRVEACISQLPEIAEAACRMHGHLLTAWVVPSGGIVLTCAGLMDRLRVHLAPWEVPSRVEICQALPRTPNGKLDHKALAVTPEPVLVGPRTPLEKQLLGFWQAALKRQDVDVYSQFFEAGGHSLAAMELVSMILDAGFSGFHAGELVHGLSPAEMAEYLSQRTVSHPPNLPHLTPLRSSGNGRPLIILPGGLARETELLVYASLLPMLPSDRKIFGARAHYYSNLERSYRTVGDLASRICREISNLEISHGFDILTDCVGVTLAWEVACQMQAEKRLPHNLIAMDPRRTPRWDSFFRRILHQRGLWKDPKNKPPEFFAYAEMIGRHRPTIYSGRVHWIWSESSISASAQRAFWRKLCSGPQSTHDVRGNHETYIRDHRVELSAVLSDLLINHG